MIDQQHVWRSASTGHEVIVHGDGDGGEIAIIRTADGGYTRIELGFDGERTVSALLPHLGFTRDEQVTADALPASPELTDVMGLLRQVDQNIKVMARGQSSRLNIDAPDRQWWTDRAEE